MRHLLAVKIIKRYKNCFFKWLRLTRITVKHRLPRFYKPQCVLYYNSTEGVLTQNRYIYILLAKSLGF